ncbi:MAG TPA: IS1380 family transposase [Gammaproteobacteria bacterium]|nr:IS1380 family transposase [Gammaproteobacteria bacterium]
MILHDVWQLSLGFHQSKPIEIEPVEEHLSSDAGLLLFRELDEQVGLSSGFSSQLTDLRTYPTHSILQMVRSRVYGILAGYEDQNDHDSLRSDSVFKLIANRLPDDLDLASQPTLSRFENSVTPSSLLRLEEWFIQRFVDSFEEPPKQITLDIDVFDDPTHGEQQLTFFHGYYNQYQYLIRAITCAENDMVVLPTLLYGTAPVALGAAADIRRIVHALRERFPDVPIHLRADSGYASPGFYECCEELRIDYSIGIGMNPVLKRESEVLLNEALEKYEKTGKNQRLFTMINYQAKTWSQPRRVVLKCEVNSKGTNRRAIVTNRPGAEVLPGAAYDEYADRGESENRNKELKCELCCDRLSDHRYMANCFRMFLHCAAHNLLVHLRQRIATPPNELAIEGVPAEASTGKARRRIFNRRRQRDPLGEGHACTWRLMLIKVAARFTVTARRVRVFLSGSWPYLDYFRKVGAGLVPES